MNNPGVLAVMGLSLALWGCASHWRDNDEHTYLHQPVESTAELALPEGTHHPDGEAYMPVPASAVSFPATREKVDLQPPAAAG